MIDPRPLRIGILVGEASGDQLGAGLIAAIRQSRADASFIGLAGERMAAQGMSSFFSVHDVAVIGFVSILHHLPRIVLRVHQTVGLLLRSPPDVLVIIDSPGFTHAVAKRVARRCPGLPIVAYVSPQVWAWRAGRVPRMVRYVDHVLALLPFEPAFYERHAGPPCTYVGHPLIENWGALQPAPGERTDLKVRPVLVVLPGSRQSEITSLMDSFGEAVKRIAAETPNLEVLLPAVPHLLAQITDRAALWPVRPTIITGEAEKFAAFRRAHAALAASGTVTLELGLSGVPTVVAYRIEPIVRVAKRFSRLPSIVLTNIVLGENAVPEFLDGAASPDGLARAVLPLLRDSPARDAQIRALGRLAETMRVSVPPSVSAADIVIRAAETGATRPR